MFNFINGLLFLVSWICFINANTLKNTEFIMPKERIQRSIYGHSSFETPASINPLDHLTKDELLSLLEAYKEVEGSKGQMNMDVESSRTTQPGASPPVVPLSVSLPAFVPIQLSAMYTAPQQGVAPGAAVAPSPAASVTSANTVTEAPAESPNNMKTSDSKDINDVLLRLLAAKAFNSKPAPIIISGPKQLISSYKPPFRIYSSSPIYSHSAPHLKLVPSSHLLSNWL